MELLGTAFWALTSPLTFLALNVYLIVRLVQWRNMTLGEGRRPDWRDLWQNSWLLLLADVVFGAFAVNWMLVEVPWPIGLSAGAFIGAVVGSTIAALVMFQAHRLWNRSRAVAD